MERAMAGWNYIKKSRAGQGKISGPLSSAMDLAAYLGFNVLAYS
jgi:hypothetical protein